ncbi:MAG: hypothetical protein OEW19_12610, partial [Acidobacteriota bacterium]|nr:hypothetical protein [Acidobacteriota bacterium]
LMLGLSLLLALGMYVVMSLTWGGVLIGWSRGWSSSTALGAARGVPTFLIPAFAAAVAWWVVGAALTWMDRHSGEIGAWFIATLNWTDVTWLTTGATWLGEWVRTVAAPFAALVWFGDMMVHSGRPWLDRSCLTRALSPVRLLAASAIALITLWAPLEYGLYWVPPGLPPTWIEPAFAVAKLALLALVGAVGVSLIGRLAAARDANPHG